MAESHVADPAHSVKNLDNTPMKKKLRINVRFWHAIEAATLVILAVIVWGMFSLPAVFYFGQQAVDKVPLHMCFVLLYATLLYEYERVKIRTRVVYEDIN